MESDMDCHRFCSLIYIQQIECNAQDDISRMDTMKHNSGKSSIQLHPASHYNRLALNRSRWIWHWAQTIAYTRRRNDRPHQLIHIPVPVQHNRVYTGFVYMRLSTWTDVPVRLLTSGTIEHQTNSPMFSLDVPEQVSLFRISKHGVAYKITSAMILCLWHYANHLSKKRKGPTRICILQTNGKSETFLSLTSTLSITKQISVRRLCWQSWNTNSTS